MSTNLNSLPLRDVLFFGLWLTATILTLRNLKLIHQRVFPNEDFIESGLFCCLLFCAGLVLSATLLNCFGLVSSANQLLLLLLATWAAVRAVGKPEPSSTERSPFEGMFVWGFMLLLAHTVVDGILKMPTDFDSLWYHMPLIDSWLQSGSLHVPDCARWYFPGNSELVGIWATGMCSGDFLVPLNNVPVVCLWALATATILRKMELPNIAVMVATAAVLAVYTTIHETVDASNDLMVVACFSASLAYLMPSIESESTHPQRSRWWLIGISLGLLAGVKHFALGYAFGGLCLVLLRSAFIVKPRNFLGTMATVIAAAIPFGGYWYLRNWWHTGLFLYPIGATQELGELIYPNLWSTSIMGNNQPLVLKYLADAVWEKCGPVHYVCLSLLPVAAFFLLFPRLTGLNRRRPGAIRSILIAAATAGCLLIWLVTPYCVEDEPGTLNHLKWAYTPVRYGLCFLSMAVVLCSAAALRRSLAMAWLVGCVVAFQWIRLLWNHQHQVEIGLVFLLAVDGMIFLRAMMWISRRSYAVPRVSLIVLTALLLVAVGRRSADWHNSFLPHFQRYTNARILEDIVSTGSNHSILVFDQRSYPYFGSARENRVVQPAGFVNNAEASKLIRERAVNYVVARRRPEYTVYAYSRAFEELEDLNELQLILSTSHLKFFTSTSE